jgi:hypothetical protein
VDEVWRMSRRKQTKPLRLNEDEPQALGKSNFEKKTYFLPVFFTVFPNMCIFSRDLMTSQVFYHLWFNKYSCYVNKIQKFSFELEVM